MSLKSFVTFSCIIVAIIFLLAGFSALAQRVDANGNGMSDVWEWAYGATNLPRPWTRITTGSPIPARLRPAPIL